MDSFPNVAYELTEASTISDQVHSIPLWLGPTTGHCNNTSLFKKLWRGAKTVVRNLDLTRLYVSTIVSGENSREVGEGECGWGEKGTAPQLS